MLRTVKRLMALSLGTLHCLFPLASERNELIDGAHQREQLEHRTNPTCPRPCLLRPPFLLFLVCNENIVRQRPIRLSRFPVRPVHPHLRRSSSL